MFDFDLSETKAGEELIEIGVEKGREEGREEGREGMKEMLLMNARFRLGKVSSELKNKINSITDLDKIREFSELRELRKKVRKIFQSPIIFILNESIFIMHTLFLNSENSYNSENSDSNKRDDNFISI